MGWAPISILLQALWTDYLVPTPGFLTGFLSWPPLANCPVPWAGSATLWPSVSSDLQQASTCPHTCSFPDSSPFLLPAWPRLDSWLWPWTGLNPTSVLLPTMGLSSPHCVSHSASLTNDFLLHRGWPSNINCAIPSSWGPDTWSYHQLWAHGITFLTFILPGCCPAIKSIPGLLILQNGIVLG